MVTDREKEKIKKEAKKLLDEFAGKLEKIKIKEKLGFESNSGTREQGSGWETDQTFKDIMLANAPLVEDDFIVAEKGGWK